MRKLKPILYKLVPIWIALVLIFLQTRSISAQQNLAVATINVTISVNHAGGGAIEYLIDLNNAGEKYIDEFTLVTPFTSVSSLRASQNGKTVKRTVSHSEGGTQIDLRFGSAAIRTGQSRLIRIQFLAEEIIKQSGDFEYLVLSPIKAKYRLISSQYKLVPLPEKELSYISTKDYDDRAGTYYFSPKSPVMFVWGSTTLNKGIEFEIAAQAGNVGVTSLPLEMPGQSIDYSSVSGVEYLGEDSLTKNRWAFIPEKGELRALANVSSRTLDRIEYPKTSRCVEGLSLPSKFEGTNSLTAEMLSNYLTNQFEIGFTDYHPVFDGEALKDKLRSGSGRLSRFELLCAVQSYLGTSGKETALLYGYYLVDIFPRLDSSQPFIWIVEDGKIFDPYLGFITGLEQQIIPTSFYLKMGWLDMSKTYDPALGLRSGQVVFRPGLSSPHEVGENSELSYDFLFPKEVFAGNFFEGQVVVENPGPKLLGISDVSIDGRNYTEGATRIIPGVFQLIQPGTNQISIDFLREPNFFADTTKTHSIEILVDSKVGYSRGLDIAYTPDSRIFVGLLALSTTATALFAWLTLKSVFKYSSANWKAYRQVYRPVSKKSSQEPKPIIRTEDRDEIISIDDILS